MVIPGNALLKALRQLKVPSTAEEVAGQIAKKSKKKYQLLLQEVTESLETGARLRYFNSNNGFYYTSGTKKNRRKDVLKKSENDFCQCPSQESVTNEPPINHVHHLTGLKISIEANSVVNNKKNNCSVDKDNENATTGKRKRRKPLHDSGIAPKRKKLTLKEKKQINSVGLDADPFKHGSLNGLCEKHSTTKILVEDLRLKVHAIARELGMIKKNELMSKSYDKGKCEMNEELLENNIMKVLKTFVLSQNEPAFRANTVLIDNIKKILHSIIDEYMMESVFNDGPDAVDKSAATLNNSKMFRPYIN
ncbi:uncharacterized protein LOC119669590 isoform X1 [Teleopsis dalmanni]|uniref:uncharacterized protein LOC119669590 isoform X1 n=1 Tax=Teleopsis dalmanni TaxID=139649 RepID=UPI0018CFE51D|nr:uncharacterized protein LOC119669590 isoform X1 [Teleopsis dalmanni]